jgi:hypothetical protein
MTIKSNGNVGIGTTAPGARLTVAGVAEAIRIADSTPYMSFYNSGQTTRFGYIQHTGVALALVNEQAGPVDFYTNSALRARITSDGRLGIGTSSPAAALHIVGNAIIGQVSDNSTAARLDITAGGSGYDSIIDLGFYGTFDAAIWHVKRHGADNTFRIAFTGSGSEVPALTITSGGNVGIGTTTPALPFVVSNAGSGGLEINHSGGVGGGTYIQSYNRAASVYIHNTNYASSQTWYTDATRAMDLVSGSLGVGTSSPSARITAQINAGNYLLDLINGSETGFALRTYNHGSASAPGLVFTQGLYYGTTENAAIKFYRGGGATGGWLAFTAGAGTEYMRIADGGNVGIGTASPGTKLDVLGIGRFQASNDVQLILNGNGTSWAGITFTDSGGSENIYFNGTNGTFAIGGGGSNVANKKLHIDGGATIGANFDYTAVDANSLRVEGSILSGITNVDPSGVNGVGLGNVNEPTTGFAAPGVVFGSGNGQHGALVYGSNTMYFGTENGSDNTMLVKATLSSTGVFDAIGAVSAPLYYDRDNGAYYLNPAELSNLNNLYIQGGVAGVSNSALYTEAALEVRERGFGGAQDDTWATAPRIALHWGGRVARQIALQSNGTIAFIDGDGTSYANILAGASTFYDNTTFYSVGTERSIRFQFTGRQVYFYGRDSDDAVGLYDSVGGARWTSGADNSFSVGGYISTNSAIYGTVFYDNNNTAFYTDPASTSYVVGMNAYRYEWTGQFASGSNLNATADTSMSIKGSALLGDGLHLDTLAFNPPNLSEVWNGSSWTTISTVPDCFIGSNSSRFGGNYALSTTNTRLRLTWNSYGYRFIDTLIVSGSAQGNELFVTIEGSTDGTTWVTTIPETNIGGNWPGYNVLRYPTNTYNAYPYMRITLRRTLANSNDYTIQNISLLGQYGGGNRLLSWDANRNITASGSWRAPAFYDSDNTNFFVDPTSTSVLTNVRANTIQFSGGNEAITLNNGTYHMLRDPGGRTALFLGGSDPANYHDNTIHYFRDRSGNNYAYLNSVGMYAASFNDFNDTAYYTNPAGTSILNYLSITADEGLGVKGIRGAFTAGSDNQGIHLFSNVDIGYPSGWGGGLSNTPNRGLSVYGGIRAAYGSGFITADTSVRAPIFYDTDNTGYYIDAFSTSVLNNINVAGGIGSYDNAGSDPYGKISVTRNTDSSWSYYGLTRAGQLGMGMGINTSNQFFIGGTTAGYNGVLSGSPWLLVTTGGDVYSLTSSRAPIFYDSADSGYSWNPNTSAAHRFTTPSGYIEIGPMNSGFCHFATDRGQFYFGQDIHADGVYFDYDNTARYLDLSSTDISISGAGSAIFAGELTLSNYSIGNLQAGALNIGRTDLNYEGVGTWASDIRLGILANCSETWEMGIHDSADAVMSALHYNGAGVFTIGRDIGWGTSYLVNPSSMRAPIFYDQQDTGYYVDPNTTGLAIRTAGYWIADTTVWAGDINGKIQYHDNSWYFSSANRWIFRASAGTEPFTVTQAGIAVAATDMRAPLFYDNNNTAFYVDPNSWSYISRLITTDGISDLSSTGGGVSGYRLLAPGGGAAMTGSSTITGAIKVRIPTSALGSNTMCHFDINVYTYDGQSFTIRVGGYNYSDTNKTWINNYAYMLSGNRAALNVRFGWDGTSQCVWIGELSTVWSYPQVSVTNFAGGYSNFSNAV